MLQGTQAAVRPLKTRLAHAKLAQAEALEKLRAEMHVTPASQDEYDGPDLTDAEEVTHAGIRNHVVTVSPDTCAPEIAIWKAGG